MIVRQDFKDRCDNITKDIVSGDYIRVGCISIDNYKLVLVLIIPEHPIYTIRKQLDMMISFCSREEEVGLPVLVLEDQLGSIFVWEHAENWIIWLMLHYDILIFDMVEF